MTGHPRRTADCLDPETLAALIDGRLTPIERERAQEHLTGCGDCYESFVEAARLNRDLDAHVEPLKRPFRVQRAVWYGTLGAVAATVIAVAVIRPFGDRAERQLDGAMQDLADASAQSRLTEGRLSGPFNWAPLAGPTRTFGPLEVSPDIQVRARQLQDLSRTLPQPLAAQASGVALLALGETDGAIQALRTAADAGDSRASIDLSAALLERFRLRGDRRDAEAAKASAEAALARNPTSAEATFNLALATAALGQKDVAIKLWARYAALDPNSKWAAEAQAHAKALGGRRP